MASSLTTVAAATEADIEDLIDLHRQMFEFYDQTPPDRIEDDLRHYGPGGTNDCSILIARHDGAAAGLIVFYTSFVIGKGINGFMQDLYIAEPFRRYGIGRALMKTFTQIAQSEDWWRVDWRVDRLNLDARIFYDLLAPDGFKLDRLCYRLSREDISRIAAL